MNDYSCWQVLEIEPTNDEASIKKAYAKLLKHNKPDKNPDGFRQLRAAYEQALEARHWYDFAQTEEYDGEIHHADRSESSNSDKSNNSGEIEDNSNHKNEEIAEVAIDTQHNLNDIDHHHSSDYNDDSPISTDHLNGGLSSSLSNIETIDDSLLIDAPNPDFADDAHQQHTPCHDDDMIYYQLASNMARWRQAWQQIIDDAADQTVVAQNTIANSTNPNALTAQAAQPGSDSDSNIAIHPLDQNFYQLLSKQLDELQQQPLDAQSEFEEDLLIWFSEQATIFTKSYQLAKSHFAWDRHLNEWQRYEYPWFHLAQIDQKYQQLANFQTPASWIQYLASYYPAVYNIWELKIDGQFGVPKRWDFIDYMHFPYRAKALAVQLEQLDNELEIFQQQESELTALSAQNTILTASYWREHPQIQALKRWIFTWVIRPQDFIILAAISIGLPMLIWLFSNSEWQQYLYDGIGVFLTISLTYLFWQFLLALFVDSQRFVHKGNLANGWLTASTIFYVIFYLLWYQRTGDSLRSDILHHHTAFYLICHLAGLNLFLASNNQEENIFITFVSCNFALFLLLSTLILPIATVMIDTTMQASEDAIAFSPIFWLVPIAPTFLISIGERLTRTHSIFYFIEKIGYMVLGGLSSWGVVLLGFILYAYCVEILPDMDFGFTAIALLVLFAIPVLVNYFTTLNKHFKA